MLTLLLPLLNPRITRTKEDLQWKKPRWLDRSWHGKVVCGEQIAGVREWP